MVWIPEIVITMVIITPIILADVEQTLNGESMLDNKSFIDTIVLYIVETGFTILSIYLIYKWSKEWNKQFPNSSKVNP